MQSRRVMLMATCLAGGTIIAVAVAWGCAMFSTPNWRDAAPIDSRRAAAIRHRYAPPGWPLEHAAGYEQRGFGVRLSWTHTDPANPAERPDASGSSMLSMQVMELSAGWPLPALRCGILADGPSVRYVGALRPSGQASTSDLFSHALPCQPLVLNLLADSIFFAAVLWLAARGPWETRRRWREWHKRCGACGYPRGCGSTCTECGSDLTYAWFRGKG